MQERKCRECGGPLMVHRGARGYCSACYQRRRKRGELEPPLPRPTPEQRVDAALQVDHATGCWLWTGPVINAGYGSTSVNGRPVLVHRFQYERYTGPIPDGLQIDHLCRTRLCGNPQHLEAVTARENALPSPITLATINGSKTHCVNGHEFTAENTYHCRQRSSTGRLGRQCKTCNRLGAARRSRAAQGSVSS